MIYPDFDELIGLKSKVSREKISHKNKVKSPMIGDFLSSFRGSGMEFSEVRKYVIGDDIRKIDWSVTARVGKPHIKIFEEERELNVLLCVDVNNSMRFGTRGTFKSVQAARCASLLGWCANANGDSVGSYLFGNSLERNIFLRPKNSRRTLWEMLRALSSKEDVSQSRDSVSLSVATEFIQKNAKPGSLVFIISDFIVIDDDFQQQLSYLSQKARIVLISVNDPADKEITSAGNILFAANDQEIVHVGTSSKTGQANYRKQWEENRAELQKITNKLGVQVIGIKTDGDAFYDLFYGLK